MPRRYLILILSLLAPGLLLLVPATLIAAAPSPAERQISVAERALASAPENVAVHNRLAMALARRARETADMTFYERADQALAEAVRRQPDNFESQRVRTWILLGRHEFAAALESARTLQRRFPDDLTISAMLTDAQMQLGRYQDAESTAQRLLDLRPGSAVALTRGAHVRELTGDLPGAITWMREAYGAIRPSETEDRAWILTQLGHLHLAVGDPAAAESVLSSALEIYPEYHYAVNELAKVRTAQRRHAEAAALRERHCELAPHPENFFYWAAALERAGNLEQSARVFAEFEGRALAESESNDNANHELVRFYLGTGDSPAKALEIAVAESGRRQDLDTLHLLAWAQQRAGHSAAAKSTIAKVLAVGTVDPEIRERAALING